MSDQTTRGSARLAQRIQRALPPQRWVRRVTGALAMIVALGVVGTVYSAFAPAGDAAPTASQSLAAQKGQQLFDQTCITCHGANLQGVNNRGPSLIGVGQAAAYFQLRTGRMPLSGGQGAQAEIKPPRFDETQIEQIAAYIQAHGGGPQVPAGSLSGGDMGDGGVLFRLNCASCHNLAGKGGALTSGKHAPSLSNASDRVIYAAMLSGPENMPKFGDNQVTPAQKKEIINYIQSLNHQANAGGFGLGRIGAMPEGLIIWIVGIAALLLIVFWIGAKA